jgi:putative phosphonate metabolism protein
VPDEIPNRGGAARGRYALYWAPSAVLPLARLGATWLGRDAEGDAQLPQPQLPAFDSARVAAVTAEPRRYGLHATLKPPFALAPGADLAMLRQALVDFGARSSAVPLPPLRVTRVAHFIALTLASPCPELDALAADCVTQFDRFRAPPPSAELARCRAAGLSAAEEAHLARWGYPYVFDCFRFHVSLTGPLDPAEAETLLPALTQLFEPVIQSAMTIADIALFHEPQGETPFHLVERFALRKPSIAWHS